MKLEGFPDYVKEYHEEVASTYDDPVIGNRVAWEAVKYRLDSSGKQVVAQEKDFRANRVFRINLKPTNKKIVTQAEDGSITLDAVLASTDTTADGNRFTEEALRTLADKINSQGITVPAVDSEEENPHEEFENIAVSSGFDPIMIRNKLSKVRGKLDNAKAAVKDGKLWLQAKLDETFKSVVDSFSNVSIETLSYVNPDGTMTDPDPFGLIFTNRPKDQNAQILS